MAYPVQALVVDARPKHNDRKLGAFLFELRPLLGQHALGILSHEIHLMDEQEDFGFWTILLQPVDAVTVIVEIL